MNYEMRLINSIVDTGEIVVAINEGVDGVFVEYKDMWNFIMQHYDKHGKTPSKDTLKAHFTDFDFVKTTEPLPYYIDEAKTESLTMQARRVIAQAHSLLLELGPKEALAYMMENTSRLYKYSSKLKDTDLVGEWKDRVEELKKRAADPDKVRKKALKARYNLTLDDYRKLEIKQDFKYNDIKKYQNASVTSIENINKQYESLILLTNKLID
jgi:hypothetical protein